MTIRHDGRPIVLPLPARAPVPPLGSAAVLNPSAPEFAVFRMRPVIAVPRAGAGQ
jgi:hypothetical protein